MQALLLSVVVSLFGPCLIIVSRTFCDRVAYGRTRQKANGDEATTLVAKSTAEISALSKRKYPLISRIATPSTFIVQVESSDHGRQNVNKKQMLDLILHHFVQRRTVLMIDLFPRRSEVLHICSACVPGTMILAFSECRSSSWGSVLARDGGAVFCTHLFN